MLIRARGSRIATSTSKIKKMIVIKKKRNEKGMRALLKGSNPHSKGLNFSRSFKDFFPIKTAVALRTKEIDSERAPKTNRVINSLD